MSTRWDGQTNLADEFHALENLAKDDMLPIQPSGYGSGNELKDAFQCAEKGVWIPDTYELRACFGESISRTLSPPYSDLRTVGVFSCSTNEMLMIYYSCDLIHSPALAIDKRPGLLCLSLLKQNKGVEKATIKWLSQVLIGETFAIDRLSTSPVTPG